MDITLEAEAIEAIWSALRKPIPHTSSEGEVVVDRIVEAGWASVLDMEDYLLSQDSRTETVVSIDLRILTKSLELPLRWSFPRPERRNDEFSGYEMLSAADATALFIWIERLGFSLDVTRLAASLCSRISAVTHLTFSEILVVFYEQSRHRLCPVFLSTPYREWHQTKILRHKTPLGYRLEYAVDDGGRALWLNVSSPKYRKRPEPQSVICSACGLHYMQGSRTDERTHRAFHRRRFAVIQPKPNRRLTDALVRNQDARWVTARSPKWKRQAVYERAVEFKREFRYDFVQWSLDARDDPGAVGFLFSDEQGRIVGACSFRRQQAPSIRGWRLDWIWICPDARRCGHLSRHWARFVQRFGIFDIEPPISDAMQSFLRKHAKSA